MKILRSKKALSPVVASIILIAVTVAVSIAVAAWMGALTFSFMGGAENLNVGNPWGWNLGNTTVAGYVYLNVTNNGGNSLVLNTVRIGSTAASMGSVANYHSDATSAGTIPLTLKPGESAGLKITYTGHSFTASVPYTISLVTATNKEFQTTGTPPGP